MAGLVLKLAPNERVLINGVVMENGPRKAVLKIKTPNAAILRLRDALHPEDATTPVTRAYYTAQLAVAGNLETAAAAKDLTRQLADLAHALEPINEVAVVAKAWEHLAGQNFYGVMRTLQPLIEVEKQLLGLTATAPTPAALGAQAESPVC